MVMSLRTFLLAAALFGSAATLFVSFPAVAQQSGTATDPAAGTTVQRIEKTVERLGEAARETAQSMRAGAPAFVLTSDQLIGIAGGALIGAIAADLVFHGGAGFLVGAVAGGYIGSWFYPSKAPLPGPS